MLASNRKLKKAMTNRPSILPMKRMHIHACEKIVRASEPWQTLKESIDFSNFIAAKQAFVCLSGDSVLGFAIYDPKPVFARGGYLRAIAVHPLSRSRGIGKFMLTHVENDAMHYADNLYLCVSSFNHTARRFYTAQGYVKIGSIPGLIRSTMNEIIMWKRFGRTATSRKDIR